MVRQVKRNCSWVTHYKVVAEVYIAHKVASLHDLVLSKTELPSIVVNARSLDQFDNDTEQS
jgi:hypothetical protein